MLLEAAKNASQKSQFMLQASCGAIYVGSWASPYSPNFYRDITNIGTLWEMNMAEVSLGIIGVGVQNLRILGWTFFSFLE